MMSLAKRAWQRNRYHSDPEWRQIRNTRSRICELQRSARFHERRLVEIAKRIRELTETLPPVRKPARDIDEAKLNAYWEKVRTR
jgi:hypothetical protein